MAGGSTNPYSLASLTSGGAASKASSAASNPFSLSSITSGPAPKKKGGFFNLPGISTLTQLGAHALSTAATALNQPQQVVTHLVAGDLPGAGKALGRTAINTLPTSLVGLKLPYASKAFGDPNKERLTFTEALAKDGFTGLKTLKAGPVGPVTRFLAETATDPVSYVTGGISAPAKAALKDVAEAGGADLAKAITERGVRGLTKEEAARFSTALGERAPALTKTLDKAPGGLKIGLPGGPKATVPGTSGAGTALREATGRGIQRLSTGTADLVGGALGERAPRLATALDTAAMSAQEHVVNPVLSTVNRTGRLLSNVKRVEGAFTDAGVDAAVVPEAASLVRKAEQAAVAEVGTTVAKHGSELRAAIKLLRPPEDAVAKFLVSGGKEGLEKFPEFAKAVAPILERTGAFQTALTGVSSRLAGAGTREAAAEAVLKPAVVERLQREVVPLLREQGIPEDVIAQITERGATRVIPKAPELRTGLSKAVDVAPGQIAPKAVLPGLTSAAAPRAVPETEALIAKALRNPEVADAVRQLSGRGSSMSKELIAAMTKDGVSRPEQFAEVGQYLLGRGGLESAPTVRAVLDKLPSTLEAARAGRDALGIVPDAVTKALAESRTPMDAVMNLAVRGSQKDAERALEHTILNSGFDEKTVSALRTEIQKAVKSISDEDMNKFVRGWEKAVSFWRRGAVRSPGFHIRNIAGNTWVNLARGTGIGRYFDAAKIQLAIRETAGNSAFREDIAKLGLDGALEKHLPADSLRTLYDAQANGVFSSNFFHTDLRHAGLAANLREDVRAGVGAKIRHPVDSFLHPLQVFGESAEDWARFANYLQGIHDGLSPKSAADMVRRYLFDYQDLTPFERHGLKNVVPFYTFMRKNTPLQFAELIQQPGKFSTLFHARQELDPQNRLPETSGEAAFKAVQPLTSAAEGHFGEAARGLGSLPGGPAGIPRTLLENSLGVSNFTGRSMAPQGRGANLLSSLSPGAAQAKKLLSGTTPQRVSILTGIQQPTSANTAGGAAAPKPAAKKVAKPKIKKAAKPRKPRKVKIRATRKPVRRAKVRLTRPRPRIGP